MSAVGGILGGLGGVAAGLLGAQQAAERRDTAGAYADQAAAMSREQLRLAMEQWQRYKDVFGPVDEAAARLTLEQLQAAGPLARARMDAAKADLEAMAGLRSATAEAARRSIARFEPLEARVVQDALQGVTADTAGAAGRAAADVRQSFAKAREASERSLAGLGLGAGRLAAADAASRLAEAAAEAAGRTRAVGDERRRAEEATRELRLGALGLRRGIPEVPRVDGIESGIADLDGGSELLRAAMSGLSAAGRGLGDAGALAARYPGPDYASLLGSSLGLLGSFA